METSEDADKKVNRAKSYVAAPPIKLKNEPTKRKSFNANEAVRSLDQALVRLKKSKLVNGECVTASSTPTSPERRRPDLMFMDLSSNTTFCTGIDNASLMSMNFSHYELARNLSSSLCNSEGAFSSNTSNTQSILDLPDTDVKNEHLERYFRSAEMWSRKYRDGGPSNIHSNITEK